jgi:hypothetical protein
MIDKKNEISTTELNLFPIQGKNIDLSFNGDRISSDGGLLLLRELDSQLNLLSSISKCIRDERDQRYVDNSVKELLIQRVFQIAAGYEDCNDCNDTNNDTYGQQELALFNNYSNDPANYENILKAFTIKDIKKIATKMFSKADVVDLIFKPAQ